MSEVGTEAWARNIQHPYEPLGWQKSIGYKSVSNRCCASVHETGRSVGFHQCGRKPKVFYGDLGYCGQHDPANVVKRREEQTAKYRAIAVENRRQAEERERIKKRNAAVLDAIQQIAAGHNDPRSLAIEVLTDAGEWPTP